MVGADLANLANEAALQAARRHHEQVTQADFTDALEKIVLGAPRGTVLSDEDRRRVAYHESGHAVVGMLTPGADPVRKVSIIPRGQALGVTFAAPDDDRANYEESWLRARIKVALGGRVAEEVVFGTITTGAESDIQQLTQIARGMVGRWGMSDAIGPIAVLPQDQQGMLLPGAQAASEHTQRLVDDEVRRIVEESYLEVRDLADRPPRQAGLADRGAAPRRDAGRGRRVRGRSSSARARRNRGRALLGRNRRRRGDIKRNFRAPPRLKRVVYR